MSTVSASRRRRLCIALPVVALAATVSAAAQAQRLPLAGLGFVTRHTGFEVALKLNMFGEISKPVVVAQNAERMTLSGIHNDTPWSLEFTIIRQDFAGNLRVVSRLRSGDEVLASPIRNATVGQRVVVRADDDFNVAMVIRRV